MLCIFVFLVYSRVPEVIGYYLGNLHIPMIMMAVLSCCFLLNGTISNTLLSLPGLGQLGFTLWMFCCIPTSVWPGGSFHTVVFEWTIALITYCVTAGLISTVKDAGRLTASMALGVVAIIMIYVLFGNHWAHRVGMDIAGTLGNPNLFALQLLMGMPFCLYMIYRSGLFSLKGGFYCLTLLGTLYLVGLAGSRSGFIALGLGLLVVLIRASVLGKLGLILVAVVGLLSATALLPRTTVDRYITLFSDDPMLAAQDSDVIGARDSAAARRHHLMQSIQLTFQHPLCGVGPGQFPVAAADLSLKSNQAAAWLQTHNSWTQVSSETGFPGLIFYLGGVFVCVKRLFTLYRKTRQDPRFSEIADIAFCLLLSFIVSIVNMTFTSAAYQPALPMLCGFAVGFLRVSAKAMSEAHPAPGVAVADRPFRSVWEERLRPITQNNRFVERKPNV